MGKQSVAEVRSSPGESSEEGAGGNGQDSETALYLRRLSKRDAVTKLKALQVGRHQFEDRKNVQASCLCPPCTEKHHKCEIPCLSSKQPQL